MGGNAAPGIGGTRSGTGGIVGSPSDGSNGVVSEYPSGGIVAPGNGGTRTGTGGSAGSPMLGRDGSASE